MSESEVKKGECVEEDTEEEQQNQVEGEEGSWTKELYEDIEAKVSPDSRRWCIFVTFEVPNTKKECMGRLCPLRSYVNGNRFLPELCPTDVEIRRMFPAGMEVRIDVERRVHEKNGTKDANWVVKNLWKFGKRDLEWSKTKEDFFLKRLESVKPFLMDAVEEDPIWKDEEESESWFIVTLEMPKYLPHPSSKDVVVKEKEGRVKEVVLPHGGVVDVLGEEIYFHRCRFYSGDLSSKLSASADLMTTVKKGDAVVVNYVENANKDGHSYIDVPQKCVALLVYSKSGLRPDIPEIAFRENSDDKYFLVRICSFDKPNEEGGGFSSGIAEVIRPTERNTNGYVKSTFKKMIDLDPSVKKVKFHRECMYHLGASLRNVDLQYFFSPYSYGLNVFCCYLKKLETPEEDITHQVSLGWKASTSFLHSTGRGALTIPPTVKEDTLLFPKSLTQCNARFYGKEGIDVSIYEKIIEGIVPPYARYFNGSADFVREEYIPARVSELIFPQGKNEGVGKGCCILQNGTHQGKKVSFFRDALSVFGFKLSEKTDLQYLILLNEPVFVLLEKDQEDLKVKDLWMGCPPSVFDLNDELSKFLKSDIHRIKFGLYLESHDLTMKDFIDVIKGLKVPRKFLPLSRESNRGTVIQLERALSKGKGRRLDLGAVSGVIRVEIGPLAGKCVTFHRKNTWVMGYNMLKADLTHIFHEGQKVNLEAEELPLKEASRGPVPFEYKHRATLVWTSKFRPRNDLERTTPEDKRSSDWLKKRNLDAQKFQQLINGKLPIINSQFACKNGNNMLKYRDVLDLSSGRVQSDGSVPHISPERLPVLRHGPEAARICESALSITGPNDQRIFDVIRNEENAQMAFHIHKALGRAIEYYISNNSSSSFSMRHSQQFQSNRNETQTYEGPYQNNTCGTYMNGGNSSPFTGDNFRDFSHGSNNGTHSFQQQQYQQRRPPQNDFGGSWGSNNVINQQVHGMNQGIGRGSGSQNVRGTKRHNEGVNSGFNSGMKRPRGPPGTFSRALNGVSGRGGMTMGMKNPRGGWGGYRN